MNKAKFLQIVENKSRPNINVRVSIEEGTPVLGGSETVYRVYLDLRIGFKSHSPKLYETRDKSKAEAKLIQFTVWLKEVGRLYEAPPPDYSDIGLGEP